MTEDALDHITVIDKRNDAHFTSGIWGTAAEKNKGQAICVCCAGGTPAVPGKAGYISPEVLPILESLNLDAEEWVNTVESYKKRFHLVAGTVENIRKVAKKMEMCWLKGCQSGKVAFFTSKRARNDASIAFLLSK